MHKYLGSDQIGLESGILTLCLLVIKVSPFTNRKDPNEILHTQALHQGLHFC